MNILGIIARRSSCRSYRPDPVPREHLDGLVEAVRLWIGHLLDRLDQAACPRPDRRLAEDDKARRRDHRWLSRGSRAGCRRYPQPEIRRENRAVDVKTRAGDNLCG